MLTFTPVTQRDIARLRRYYKSCEYQLCEYSALVKLMWRSHLHPSWAEGAGCLIVRNFIDGQYCFDYPVPGPNGDEDAALTLIEDDCRERDIPLVLSVVPQDKAERLAARYPYFRFSSPRVWRDYIYAAEDLRDFAGRRYSGQRNHINKFRKLYPDAAFRPLGKSDLPLITQFFRDYEAVFTKASDSAKNELRCAEKMLRMTGSPHFLVGGMELDGRLLSVAMAERCGDTLQIHIEKALYGYEGVYPATVQAFAQEFAVDGVRWLNREDDAGDKGLRTSKLQYLPDHLGAKLRFDVLNELVNMTEIPTLTTARRAHRRGQNRLRRPLSRRRPQPLVGLRLPQGLRRHALRGLLPRRRAGGLRPLPRRELCRPARRRAHRRGRPLPLRFPRRRGARLPCLAGLRGPRLRHGGVRRRRRLGALPAPPRPRRRQML